MPTSVTNPIIQHLRRAVLGRDGAGLSDGQLLDCYVQGGDEAAFEALVRRHGPMVLGVCRRILRDSHEVEDAFQATFLVLVRKAASVVPAERVGNFLHGVAWQTAVRARAAAAKRRRRERQVADLPEPQARPAARWDDVRPTLDQELARLPGQYRAAILLCDLEGCSHREAALHLGCPVGTLASRLSRGRRLLARRLAGRGVALSGAAVAALLSENAASACVPASLVSSTIRAGSLLGVAGAAVAEATPVGVVTLTQGVLKAMSTNKVGTVVAGLLMAGVVALAGGLLTRSTAAADQPDVPKKEKPPARGPVVARREKPAAPAAPKRKKDQLEVRADGKQVRVRAVFGGREVHAVAERMSYDDESKRLVLEGNVRVQQRQGQEKEEVRCRKMVIDRRSGTMKIEGLGALKSGAMKVQGPAGVRFAVPMLGPVPISLDFGFPVARDVGDNQQVLNFFLGFTR